MDGDVPRSSSYGVYISELIRFTRVSSHVANFSARNKSLTAKLFQSGYRYHNTFSKFYRRYSELVCKFNVGLKTRLNQGLSEPEFYGDLVYKLKQVAQTAMIAHMSPMCQGKISFQNHINGPWKAEARNRTHLIFYACPSYQQL